MSNTRRDFLQSTLTLAVGGIVGGATTSRAAEPAPVPQVQNTSGGAQETLAQSAETPGRGEVQVPKMKLGNVEIGRLVLGTNPLYGFTHYNKNFSTAMREWYTQDRYPADMRVGISDRALMLVTRELIQGGDACYVARQ